MSSIVWDILLGADALLLVVGLDLAVLGGLK